MEPGILLLFIAGLILLIAGAELLVRGAASLARIVGVSSLVIGLTVVAFGTGSPELAVAVRASLGGQADLAVGNVIGSNIFNILFILGVSATIAPLVVAHQLVRLDVPIMILASSVFFLMSLDGRITHFEGIVLLAGIIVYTFMLIRLSRAESLAKPIAQGPEPVEEGVRSSLLWHIGSIVLGLLMLYLGSRWLVDGAVTIARHLGVSELVIGLTIVAAGTSLPEVATSVVAGIRGERDIAVGNVVGSNLYNILMVLGAAALVSDNGLFVAPAAVSFDIPVMLVVAVACLPIFFAGNQVNRWEGLMFLGYWIAYTAYVILLAARHDALDEFSLVMTAYVIPLTVATITVITWRTLRQRLKTERLERRKDAPAEEADGPTDPPAS
jgi:cation:H+ antiporter